MKARGLALVSVLSADRGAACEERTATTRCFQAAPASALPETLPLAGLSLSA